MITGRLKTVLFYCVLRSAVISQTILLRQVGVVLGPLSIFGSQKLNFTLPGGRLDISNGEKSWWRLTFYWILNSFFSQSNCQKYTQLSVKRSFFIFRGFRRWKKGHFRPVVTELFIELSIFLLEMIYKLILIMSIMSGVTQWLSSLPLAQQFWVRFSSGSCFLASVSLVRSKHFFDPSTLSTCEEKKSM